MRGASRKPTAPSSTVGGIDARGAHERSEAGSLRARELPEPGDRERAVLVDERHDVGDGRERDEVEVSLERIVRERLEELEHDAGPAELRERVRRRPRRDHRAVRQLVSRPVVIGDDDLQAEPPRRGDLVDRGDAAIDGEHEPVALVGELLERLAREAVALLEAARQVPADVGAELPERQRPRAPSRRCRRRRSRRGRRCACRPRSPCG